MQSFKKKLLYFILLIFLISMLYVTSDANFRLLNKVSGASIFFYWILYSRRLEFSFGLKLCFFFILYCTISFPLTEGSWEYTLDHLVTMTQLFFLIFFLYNSLPKENNFSDLSKILFLLFFLTYFGTNIGILPNQGEDTERIIGATSNPNVLGFTVLLGFISSFYLLSSSHNRFLKLIKKFWPILFLLFIGLLLPTGSRKSLMSIMALFGLQVLLSFKRNFAIGIAFIMFFGFISLIIYEPFFNMFENSIMGERFFDEDKLQSGTDVRVYLYQDGFNMFLSNPFFGVGLNNFRNFSHSGHVAHSYYMEILAGTGVIGFLLLFTIYRDVFKKAFKLFNTSKMHNEVVFLFNYLLTIFIMSFGFSHHNDSRHWIIMTFIFVFLDNIYMSKKSQNIQIK